MENNYNKFFYILLAYLFCGILNGQDLPFIGNINQFNNLKDKDNISKIILKNSYGSIKEYYFDKGNLNKERYSSNKKEYTTIIYSYDSINRLIKQEKNYENILLKYDYNKLKQAISNNSEFNISFLNYNYIGFPELIEIKDPDFFSPYKIQLFYNDIGLISKQTSYENKELISIENYTYNDESLIKSIHRSNNKNITYPIIIYGSSRKIYSDEYYLYKFDSKGNWIKKTYISNNKTFNIDERNISYIK